MKHILVALDGSPESEEILVEVERLGTNLTVIDLLQVLPGTRGEAAGKDGEKVLAYLRHAAARISGRSVRTNISRGDPAEEIAAAAARLGADLIALTTHARRGLSHLLLGSVAEEVVRNSSVPVLLVRPGFPRAKRPLKRILVAVDGSPESRQIAGAVKGLVEDSHADVILLQVVVPLLIPPDPVTGFVPVGIPEQFPDPLPSLQDFAAHLQLEGVQARPVVATGGAADQILDQARLGNVDVIAMATAGRKGMSKWLIGSVAEDVLKHSDRPILLHRISTESDVSGQERHLHVHGAE